MRPTPHAHHQHHHHHPHHKNKAPDFLMENPKMRFSWFRKSTAKAPLPPPLSAAGDLPLSLSPVRKSYHFNRSLICPQSNPPTQRIPTKSAPTASSSSNYRNSRANSVIKDDRSGFSARRKTGDAGVKLNPIKTEREVKKIGGPAEAIDERRRSSGRCRGRKANGPVKEESAMEQGKSSVRRSPNGSNRIRVRVHSPRFAKRSQVHNGRGSSSSSPSRKSLLSKSLAMVKSSSDPHKDFKESMVEMIVENNIRTSKDLEELLACYLSLNYEQHHDVIIEVFTQIWFYLNNNVKEIRK